MDMTQTAPLYSQPSSLGPPALSSWLKYHLYIRFLFVQSGLSMLLSKITEPCRPKPQKFTVSSLTWALLPLNILWKTSGTIHKIRKKEKFQPQRNHCCHLTVFPSSFSFIKKAMELAYKFKCLLHSWDEAKYIILSPDFFNYIILQVSSMR